MARYMVRVLTPANAAASGTVSASGGAMRVAAKSRFSCDSVERGMARSRVGCGAGFSTSKGRTTPSRPSGLSRSLRPPRAGPTDRPDATDGTHHREQIHDTQSRATRSSPCATAPSGRDPRSHLDTLLISA